MHMPICPQCRSHFHMGAKDQCPECGYCLPQAEARLGYGLVDFPRVLDAAGVLTRDECRHLMQYLEKLERKIRPVALCVYLTDRGQREELAMHAHWILNHAQINHRAFGRRDRRLAIEESKMQMSFPQKGQGRGAVTTLSPANPANPAGDVPAFDDLEPLPQHHDDAPRRHQHARRFWTRLVDAYYHLFYPTPPPVEKEWMLILVLDVQLGRACFSWGYRLDSYVNGEELSKLVPCAHTRFRNKDVLGGIKTVMRRVTRCVAGRAVDINAMIRQDKRQFFKRQMLQASAEAQAMGLDPSESQTPKPTGASQAALDATQKLLLAAFLLAGMWGTYAPAQDAPSLTPLPTTTPEVFLGRAASESSFPSWSSDELQSQAAGQVTPRARALFAVPRAYAPVAPVPEQPVEPESKDSKGSKSSKTTKVVTPPSLEPPVTTIDLKPWRKPSPALDGAHFIDEQFMLSELEARDIERQLALLNANKPYHLYLCVMDGTRGQTPEYSAAAYLPLVVEMGQQALLIQYLYGGEPAITISGQGLSLSTEELAEWQAALNTCAAAYSNARDAIMVANDCASDLLQAQMKHMREGGVDDTLYLPKAEVEVQQVQEEVEQQVSTKDMLLAKVSEWVPYMLIMLSSVLCSLIYLLLRKWHRRKALLLETVLDRRLSAEFGSGISPSVLYKEKYSSKRQQRELDEL